LIKLAKICQIQPDRVVLELQESTQCNDCKSHCSDGFLNFLFHKNKHKKLIVGLQDSHIKESHVQDKQGFFSQSFNINDVIGLRFSENQLFKYALLLYGLPIVILTLGLILGVWLFNGLNLNADMGGIIGLISGMFLSKAIIKHNQSQSKLLINFFK
jgi:positive regulator of sigma E activity